MAFLKSIIKNSEQEKAYRRFMLRYDIYSLRIACIIGSVYHLFFLLIDLNRVVHYENVLIFRGIMTAILSLSAALIVRAKLTVSSFYVVCLFVSASTVLLSFPLDFYAGMPEYFLPNIFCLLLYVLNTGIGYPLRMKLLFSLILLTSYLFYANLISYHEAFHLTQSWNVIINIIFSLLIGYLIERYKRINYVQRTELEKTKNELNAILDSAFVSIIKTDKNGIITHFNKGAERMLGYTAEELVHKETPQIIHLEEEIIKRSNELSEQFHKKIEGFNVFTEHTKLGEHETREWTYRRKDGFTFPVQLVVSGIHNTNGEIVGYLGIATDISELKKQNLIIQEQNIELENLNNTKDKFFSIVAHDLKSPLNSLKGFSGLLIEHFDRLNKEEIVKMSIKIKDSVDNTIKMADNLITWAKIQMNDYQNDPEIISTKEIIHSVCVLYKGIALEKGISLVCELSESLNIKADKNQFEFIIRNLINNAIKYTSKGGFVKVKTETDIEKNILISITDTGVGISDSIKDELFKIGKNRSSEGTAGEKGTGLGLMLVYEFVGMNNGEISFESNEKKGTVFYLKFKLS